MKNDKITKTTSTKKVKKTRSVKGMLMTVAALVVIAATLGTGGVIGYGVANYKTKDQIAIEKCSLENNVSIPSCAMRAIVINERMSDVEPASGSSY